MVLSCAFCFLAHINFKGTIGSGKVQIFAQTFTEIVLHFLFQSMNSKQNKAGYTDNSSRGRVGRGGNACFHTSQLDHHGPTDQRTNRRTEGRTSYRVACSQLKIAYYDKDKENRQRKGQRKKTKRWLETQTQCSRLQRTDRTGQTEHTKITDKALVRKTNVMPQT